MRAARSFKRIWTAGLVRETSDDIFADKVSGCAQRMFEQKRSRVLLIVSGIW
jgi:hypothetical protein